MEDVVDDVKKQSKESSEEIKLSMANELKKIIRRENDFIVQKEKMIA